jgi:hypothetical protein
MDNRWTDYLAGARMQVDQQFSDQVRASEFTSQQWGLIMTAVEFEIDDPGDPEQATLVANTDNVETIIPELDAIERQTAGMGAGGGRSRSTGTGTSLLGRIRSYFSSESDDGADAEQYEQAVTLVDQYTTQLQALLREEDRWQELCAAAAKAAQTQTQPPSGDGSGPADSTS